jgi:hypothetical protein
MTAICACTHLHDRLRSLEKAGLARASLVHSLTGRLRKLSLAKSLEISSPEN